MKHFFFIIMLLLNFSTFFAQGSNHDYMQGVWDGGIHCEKYPVACRIEFCLIHDDEILCFSFYRIELRQYQKGGWKIYIQEYGEGEMLVDKYQFLLIKDKYQYDEFPNDFICEEVEDVNSNVLALFRHDRSELDLRGDRISGYRPVIYNIKKCSNDSIYLERHDSFHGNYIKFDLKRLDKNALPPYLLDGLFNYSVTSKRDYFYDFLDKTVGVIKENDSDDDQASKKDVFLS